MAHDFEGWPMEWDIRRIHGSRTVITRLLRAAVFAIPLIVAGKTLNGVLDGLRHYTVKTCKLPLVLALTAATHVPEIPGMLVAYRGQTVGATSWR